MPELKYISKSTLRTIYGRIKMPLFILVPCRTNGIKMLPHLYYVRGDRTHFCSLGYQVKSSIQKIQNLIKII